MIITQIKSEATGSLAMSAKKSGPLLHDPAPVAESLLSRLIVAPVLFISFLISLFLIDRQTYGSIFARSGSRDGYYHSHQRKLAKREMDDAFQMRSKVIAAMFIFSAVTLALLAWTLESVWKGWRYRV
ncbi:hypothetical protein Z517_07144 [Fonsecaea pedrosoi CBS 271.37]|uniref:Unplaced genomic scaffold supercont1.4, whole genome shotgun sequence n=1 Tax=Fonsecaea pedrosoi CBS 271.37 TaxID=1442368 RepID=A0A0D2GIC1_9EURO|nr:uncharacterized protein Z517_07144 [Fonsecaea pedrosoi CBS 271.37]KIW80528.1 hypothetical protein Z517_07144 [Fonsecaea pedrosoi CBS 271.37]